MSLLYICPILCVNQHFVSIEIKWRDFYVSIKHISSNLHVVLRSTEFLKNFSLCQFNWLPLSYVIHMNKQQTLTSYEIGSSNIILNKRQ